jgi:hypothetical protein
MIPPWLRRRAPLCGCLGFVGGAVGSLAGDLFANGPNPTMAEALLGTAFWLGCIGGFSLLALMWAQAIYLRHDRIEPLDNLKHLGVGFASGAAGGLAAQFVYGQFAITSLALDLVVKPLCWAIAGGALGALLAPKIPNLSRWKGLAAGAAGGYAGGAAFLILAMAVPEGLGRTVGAGFVGAALGLAVLLADTIARVAWLEVTWAPGEVTKVSLGVEEVSIGGGNGDTIYANGVPPKAIVITHANGQVTCLETASGKRTAFRDGSKVMIGTTAVVTRIKG